MLDTVWFVLIAVLWIGYLFLEGFDLGVGILLRTFGRNDKERRLMLNTIGPVWDGNEVWLLTAGGATFAAFPRWYAALFSALYIPLTLVLVALIFRATAIEYRGKMADRAWADRWDWALCLGSIVAAGGVGAMLAMTTTGLPINANGDRAAGPVLSVVLFALLGAAAVIGFSIAQALAFLSLKTDGEMRVRARAALKTWIIPLAAPAALWAILLGIRTMDVVGLLLVAFGVWQLLRRNLLGGAEIRLVCSGRPSVVGVVMSQNRVPGTQCLHQRWVSPANSVAVQIHGTVEAKRLNNVGIENGAKEHHLFGSCLDHLTMVGILVRTILTQNRQFDTSAPCGESLDQFKDGVLGDGPTNERKVLSRLQTERQDRPLRSFEYLVGAVGNHGDLALGCPAPQVLLDLRVIGDQVVPNCGRESFIDVEDGLPCQAPTGAGPFDAVHVDHHRDSFQALPCVENARVVTEDEAQVAERAGVLHAFEVEQ